MQFEDAEPTDLLELRAKSELEKLQVANQFLFFICFLRFLWLFAKMFHSFYDRSTCFTRTGGQKNITHIPLSWWVAQSCWWPSGTIRFSVIPLWLGTNFFKHTAVNDIWRQIMYIIDPWHLNIVIVVNESVFVGSCYCGWNRFWKNYANTSVSSWGRIHKTWKGVSFVFTILFLFWWKSNSVLVSSWVLVVNIW